MGRDRTPWEFAAPVAPFRPSRLGQGSSKKSPLFTVCSVMLPQLPQLPQSKNDAPDIKGRCASYFLRRKSGGYAVVKLKKRGSFTGLNMIEINVKPQSKTYSVSFGVYAMTWLIRPRLRLKIKRAVHHLLQRYK